MRDTGENLPIPEPARSTKKIQQGQKTQGSEKMTTGATGKIATEITAKDRTVIRQKLIATHVQRVERSKVKVKIGVEVVIPATIELYPLPADIVALALPPMRAISISCLRMERSSSSSRKHWKSLMC